MSSRYTDAKIFNVSPDSGEDDDLIDGLYAIASEVGIHFNSAEEPHAVAVSDGQVVGGTVRAVYPYPDDALDTYEWSFSVVVSPGAQGAGVGRRLIDKLLADARHWEFKVLRVSADVVNDRLRQYLLRLGFVEGERRTMSLALG